MTQRDAFFGEVVKAAYENPNIVILSADSGAPAFNKFRVDRPNQWVHMGISEANMINVAAGLALSGKQVFCFAIIPFVTGRCFDQIKVAIALRGLPVTIVGVGAGYSYDDGGPTHYGVEDIGIMKNLKGIEIWSPRDEESAKEIAEISIKEPAFRYVRLDRHVLPSVTRDPRGYKVGLGFVSYGSMYSVAMEVKKKIGMDGGVWHLSQVYPIDEFMRAGKIHTALIVIEEHFYSGSVGESISSWLHDNQDRTPLLRIAIPDHYEWENGGRAHLWKRAGLDVESITKRITEWMA